MAFSRTSGSFGAMGGTVFSTGVGLALLLLPVSVFSGRCLAGGEGGEQADRVRARSVEERVLRLLGKTGTAALPRASRQRGGPADGGREAGSSLSLPVLLSDPSVLRLFGFEEAAGKGLGHGNGAVLPAASWCVARGTFDPRTRGLLLPATRDPLRFQCALVHGTVHALQDRRPREGLLRWWEAAQGNDDALLARWAVVEGEAQFVLSLYAKRYAPELSALCAEKAGASPFLPPFSTLLVRAGYAQVQVDLFSFPRREGERFVRTCHARKGWAGVEALFERPPESTEQVLHPEQYLRGGDPPRTIVPGDLLPALPRGWRKVLENTLGALAIRSLVRGTGDAWRAMAAAEGWEGDRYALFQKGARGSEGLYWVSQWEGEEACRRFFAMLTESLCFTLKGPAGPPVRGGGWVRVQVKGRKGTALVERRGETVILLRGFAPGGADLEALSVRARTFEVR